MSRFAALLRQHMGMERRPGPLAQPQHVHNAPAPPADQAPRPKVRLPVVQGEAPRFSLQSIVEQYLENVDPEERIEARFRFRSKRSQGVLHASDISKELACKRALAYGLYEAPMDKKVDAKGMRIFDNGHFVHARLESYIIAAIEANGGQAWNEMGYEPDGKKRSGTADVGLIYTGWPYLVEIKSIKKGTPGVDGFVNLGAEADADHIGQLNQYMGLSGVHAGFVFYECKDNQDFKEYFHRFDPVLWAKTDAIADEVLAHVARGTLPDKITEEDGCNGKWCSYYRVCKARADKIDWTPTKLLKR